VAVGTRILARISHTHNRPRQVLRPFAHLIAVRWVQLVGAPPIYPVNLGPTIPSEEFEDLLEILESVQFSGGN
jgi:hypothetical protein